ncbi:MAG: FAD-dependent oxidoreductase, partial [Polyangia bacterium]|nr:FAD-dependent oxidoreductase [Polyangia bacterium]
MSDKFVPITLGRLAAWIYGDLDARGEVFGVPRELFWEPRPAPFALERNGVLLETPIGVAAGPHTQLAQNLILAYLTGSRFLELKTIQTLDELEVAKPCIDAEDATFNCEWSQELRLEESFAEYLAAFVLIHALRQRLGWGEDATRPGFLFNMSVGYNLEGILRPNVQRFLSRMAAPGEALEEAVEAVARFSPEVRSLSLPASLSDSVTLSTMHGCPPDEIERIARYLIEERGLHTTVKLNPTLLGPERLRTLLNERLGFGEINVPDEAFGHDLKWEDALGIIRRLRESAARRGVFFGLKLTNTLEVVNHRSVFRGDQAMMYMSGRALHPITMALAARLLETFDGQLPISISGGVDAFNLGEVLAAGLAPVTMCTDLLKPGGYTRTPQYLERLEESMRARGCQDLDDWVMENHLGPARGGTGDSGGAGSAGARAGDIAAARVANSDGYSRRAAGSERHQARKSPVRAKGERPLGWLDCIEAPCRAGCPAGQDIPAYLHAVASGDAARALEIIRETNPLPRITGAVCDHPCVQRCVRNHYDDPLAIRHIKRYAATAGAGAKVEPKRAASRGPKVAVIGAGPAGLTAAYDLARAGYAVTVFEGREGPGGMVSWAIPAFRLTEEDIESDLARIAAAGAAFRYGAHLGRDMSIEDLRAEGFGTIVAALGAQEGRLMGIEGEGLEGVMDGLGFLMGVRAGTPAMLGEEVCIVGGGNAAMDAARTAWRLVGPRGRVTLLYRRTRAQMPADPDEIAALEEEGVRIQELVTPVRALGREGRLATLQCLRMALSDRDASGRPRPVPIEGSEFELPCSAMIVCVSQASRLEVLERAG